MYGKTDCVRLGFGCSVRPTSNTLTAGIRFLVLSSLGMRRRPMRRLHCRIPVFVLALALGSVAAAFGQTVSTTTGAINGKITDTSGAIMPGVTISITSPSMQGTRTDVTGSDGIYRFSAIPPGEERGPSEFAGFGTQNPQGVRV